MTTLSRRRSRRTAGTTSSRLSSQKRRRPSGGPPSNAQARAHTGRDLVRFFMQMQADIKLFHWQTSSYAAHMASDALFASLVEKTDAFVEQYMGRHGRVNMGQRGVGITLRNVSKGQMVRALRLWDTFLARFPSRLLAQTDYNLLALRDDIQGDIRKAAYLLTLK